MILILCFRITGSIYWFLYAYAPTNILIRYLRSPEGRTWAIPISAALTAGYLGAIAGLNTVIETGGPGWLNLLAPTCAWNAIKLGWLALYSAWRVVAGAAHRCGRLARHAVGSGICGNRLRGLGDDG